MKSGGLEDANMLALLSASGRTHRPYLQLHMRGRKTHEEHFADLHLTLVQVVTLKKPDVFI